MKRVSQDVTSGWGLNIPQKLSEARVPKNMMFQYYLDYNSFEATISEFQHSLFSSVSFHEALTSDHQHNCSHMSKLCLGVAIKARECRNGLQCLKWEVERTFWVSNLRPLIGMTLSATVAQMSVPFLKKVMTSSYSIDTSWQRSSYSKPRHLQVRWSFSPLQSSPHRCLPSSQRAWDLPRALASVTWISRSWDPPSAAKWIGSWPLHVLSASWNSGKRTVLLTFWIGLGFVGRLQGPWWFPGSQGKVGCCEDLVVLRWTGSDTKKSNLSE